MVYERGADCSSSFRVNNWPPGARTSPLAFGPPPLRMRRGGHGGEVAAAAAQQPTLSPLRTMTRADRALEAEGGTRLWC